MAFTVDRPTSENARDRVIVIDETAIGSTTESGPITMPPEVTAVRVMARLVSGGAATINPRILRATGADPDTEDELIALGGMGPAAAFQVDDTKRPWFIPGTQIFLVAGTNGGSSDNVIRWEICYREGWES